MEDDFKEYEDQQENEEDIENTWQKSINEVAITASDWTTETILNQISKGNIELNPKFQRRSAWKDNRKSQFIESIILGLPIPQIVLAQSKKERGKFLVLDGKQRLLSIREFTYTDSVEIDQTPLRLKDLRIRKDLVGKTFQEISTNAEYEEDIFNFENQTIRTVVIKNWPDENFLYNVFLRLNTGSVQLSPQELRQALHPGDFVFYITRISGELESLREIFKKAEPDFRMRDAELLVRFFAFRYFIIDYAGSLKKFLDNTCQFFNKEWLSYKDKIESDIADFESAHEYVKTVFRENSYHKWTGMNYENRFNRAIFDIFSYYFSKPEIVHGIDRPELVESAFKDLCASNTDFLNSIERTTKSIQSTQSRFRYFGEAIQNICSNRVIIPEIEKARND